MGREDSWVEEPQAAAGVGEDAVTIRADERLVYSVSDAAECLGIGRTLMRQLINEGTIRSLKIGHRRLVAKQDLEEFVASCRGDAA